jgi:peroxiredoxin
MKKLVCLLSWISILASGATIGQKAPDFSLVGSDGKTYELKNFLGKTVVLEWFNEGCPFVVKHYSTNNMQSLQKKYTEKGVVWFTVLSSAPGKQGYVTAEQFEKDRARLKMASTAGLLDPTGKVGKLFEAKTTPHLFIINPQGVLVYDGAIDDNSSTDPKTVSSAKNYIAGALDALLSGKPVQTSTTKPYGCSIKYAS